MSEASEDLFEIANRYPGTTGLPMTVWVSPRGAARRIKVNMTHGNRMTIANTAIVAVRPVPRVVTGQLLSTDEQTVFAWVTLNEGCLDGILGGPGRHRRSRAATAASLNISRFVVEQRSRARCALITYRFMNGVYPGRMEARSEGQNAEIKLIFSG